MNADFWHDKWKNNKLGWHLDDVNPIITKYLKELNLTQGSRIFVPLCGKTKDISWLMSNAYKVVGAELNESAIKQLFDEMNIIPNISKVSDLLLYSAENIDIFVCDIFKLDSGTLGHVDAIYDRAALIAMPKKLRSKYTIHISNITYTKAQLLVNFEYDQTKMDGPPFSVPNEELKEHYKNYYKLNLLDSVHITAKRIGKTDATENIWALIPL